VRSTPISRRRIRGTGIVTRHSRRCRHPAECSCSPSFVAWVWDAQSQHKIYRTFATPQDARAWRLDQLDRIYGSTSRQRGRLDDAYAALRKAAYAALRKAAQHIDAAPGDRYEKAAAREVLNHVYAATDTLLTILTKGT
jgi:hypothetical protein